MLTPPREPCRGASEMIGPGPGRGRLRAGSSRSLYRSAICESSYAVCCSQTPAGSPRLPAIVSAVGMWHASGGLC